MGQLKRSHKCRIPPGWHKKYKSRLGNIGGWKHEEEIAITGSNPAELRQAEQFIREICLLYRKDGADEDCIMDGVGFWQARQTYGRKQGRCPFWGYAFLCIREQILDAWPKEPEKKL